MARFVYRRPFDYRPRRRKVTAAPQTIAPTGIASQEAFGSHTVSVSGAITIIPGGIASGEAFGTLTIQFYVVASAIASLEAFGSAQVNLRLLASAIASGEGHGSTVLVTGTGTTYWVATDGDDEAPGTESEPWLTLNKAATTATAGDTVYFKNGVYAQSTQQENWNSGSAANGYITFRAQNAGQAELQRTGSGGRLVEMTSESYIRFYDLKFKGQLTVGTQLCRHTYCDHIEYYDCEIYNTQYIGVQFDDCDDCVLDGCTIHPDNATGTSAGDGIQVTGGSSTPCTNITISDCEVYNTEHAGIKLYAVNGATVENCTVHDTSSHGISVGGELGRTAQNVTVRYCTLRDLGEYDPSPGGEQGLRIHDSADNVLCHHNTIDTCYGPGITCSDVTGTVELYNNTIYGADQNDNDWGMLNLEETDSATPDITFKNNVIFATRTTYTLRIDDSLESYIDLDYNLYYSSAVSEKIRRNGTTYTSYSDYKSVGGYESNTVIDDNPDFEDAPNGDFHLTLGSPAIDEGVDVGLDYLGSAPDIGRWEYISITASAIASGEAFGSGQVNLALALTGISSGEVFGSAQLNLALALTGISSAEAFGTALLRLYVVPAGIASQEEIGSHTVVPGAITVITSAIDSLEAFGSHTVVPGAITLLPGAVASLEAFGSHTVVPGAITLLPGGVASLEAFGSANLIKFILASGVASGEAFGAAQVNLALALTGIASGETFGTALLGLYVVPAGVASGEAFGTAALEMAGVLSPAGIASLEAFGSHTIVPGAITLLPGAIASQEAFGSARLIKFIHAAGVASGEAFGTAVLGLYVVPAGIASVEAFGTAALGLYVVPTGIASLEGFGTHAIVLGAITLLPGAIASQEAFGSANLMMPLFIEPAGLVSGEALGAARVVRHLHPVGIISLEAFGSHTVLSGAGVFLRALGLLIRGAVSLRGELRETEPLGAPTVWGTGLVVGELRRTEPPDAPAVRVADDISSPEERQAEEL